jgi:hypothetical protein
MQILERTFEDLLVIFTEDGWIKATGLAEYYNARLGSYFENADTKKYIQARVKSLGLPDSSYLITTKRGRRSSGTWLHPKLAVHFGRWLDMDFGIWCDDQIFKILEERQRRLKEEAEIEEGQKAWEKARIEAATGHKLLSSIIAKTQHQNGGPEKSDYQRESMLINDMCGYGYRPVNRDKLNWEELKLITALELFSAHILKYGFSLEERKYLMRSFVDSVTEDSLENMEQFVKDTRENLKTLSELVS